MIFFAAMADERWMGSIKMLAASEPEMVENLDSDTKEKLREREAEGEGERLKRIPRHEGLSFYGLGWVVPLNRFVTGSK